MSRRTLLVLVAVAVALAAVVAAWAAGVFSRSGRPVVNPGQKPGQPWFEDVAARAGIRFKHFDPATPQHLMPETMGSGVAWIDYDADGWPDLFCVQDGPLPPATMPNPPTHKLYRNNRDGTFTDVTEQVGLNRSGFGTGVAVGDYDNDGFDDLVVVLLGGIELFHNEPDGKGGRKFVEVGQKAGLTNPHYSTSCAWGDIDGDGFLDLYVCNYVEIDPAHPVTCRHTGSGEFIQCSPTAFSLTAHRLFHNNHNGTFADWSESSGVTSAQRAPGLGVLIADLDDDGKQDIYVANDLHPAYLFRNKGKGTFDEVALPSGCGLGVGGTRMAGMGVEAGDLDGSGRPSLFVTNFQGEPNILFMNTGGLRFLDRSLLSGLGPASLSKLGFGTVILDANLDGHPDLAVANGHVQRAARTLYGVPYAQSAQLFLGDGKGKYQDVTSDSGPDFVAPRVGRGLARCDFDNDGKPDLALSGVGEPIALLRNVTDTANGWIGLELIGDGKASNRNAIGAVARIEWAGRAVTHPVIGGGSYLSASDRRLTLGLGAGVEKVDRVTVRWPSGRSEEYRDLAAKTHWRLHEGRGTAERFIPPGKP